MTALIECVPNFSEGQRPEVIASIVESIRKAAPVQILNVSSDADHNRTVVTFAGSPDAVEQAAFSAIKTASTLIDLDTHRGQHPRLGATDVVPFIPLRDCTLDECVAVARRLGERVGAQLEIPVYLYEAAATRPERHNLEDVRRGEYETLRNLISLDPARQPDFGPFKVGKAGATSIGARKLLIAFNVFLNANDVGVARAIAKTIRFSNGGLRGVKASGFLVEGRAQVSMNLVDFEHTAIHHAYEMIRREADRYGVGVAFSEIVGLVPEEALTDSARWYLQLDRFNPEQILETALEKAGLHQSSTESGKAAVEKFVGQVAADTPTPGGGAVAALAGALGTALAEMVAHLTLGKKKYAEVEPQMKSIIERGGILRAHLLEAIDADMAAYDAVIHAYRLAKTDSTREAAIQTSLLNAAQTPLQIMKLALQALDLARLAATLGNTNAITDAGAAGHVALAAIESAAFYVRVNAKSLSDASQAASLREQAATLTQSAKDIQAVIVAQVETRANL